MRKAVSRLLVTLILASVVLATSAVVAHAGKRVLKDADGRVTNGAVKGTTCYGEPDQGGNQSPPSKLAGSGQQSMPSAPPGGITPMDWIRMLGRQLARRALGVG